MEKAICNMIRDSGKHEFEMRLCDVLSHGVKYNITKNKFQSIINSIHHSDTFKMIHNKQMGCYYSDDMIYMCNINGNVESVMKKSVIAYSDWASNDKLPTNLQINFKSSLGIRLLLSNVSKMEPCNFPMTSQLHHTEVRSIARYVSCSDRINEGYYIDFIRTRDMLDNTESVGINIGINKNKNTYNLKEEHYIHLSNIVEQIFQVVDESIASIQQIRTQTLI